MYSNIFKEIIDIVSNDYSGFEDKAGWARPKFYLEKINALEKNNSLTDEGFSHLVNEFLLDFHDKHLYFLKDETYSFNSKVCGFSVKAFEKVLYVTELNQEDRLQIGNRIIEIDNETIEHLATSKQTLLRDSIEERQYWGTILNSAEQITYLNEKNEKQTMVLNKYNATSLDELFQINDIGDDILYISIPNLVEDGKIRLFIDKILLELNKTNNLIMDLRNNGGGNAQLLSPLEACMYVKGEKPEITIPKRYFNCTKRNAKLFSELCEPYREIELDENSRAVLEYGEKLFLSNVGNGFVEADFSHLLQKFSDKFEGKIQPEKIVILTNEYTASAAEYFVEFAEKSSKVTTIGRATAGINDYSDLVIQKFENGFSLYYPTSKAGEKSNVHPIHGTGLAPNIYIPWTPEHLERDVTLEAAISYLAKSKLQS